MLYTSHRQCLIYTVQETLRLGRPGAEPRSHWKPSESPLKQPSVAAGATDMGVSDRWPAKVFIGNFQVHRRPCRRRRWRASACRGRRRNRLQRSTASSEPPWHWHGQSRPRLLTRSAPGPCLRCGWPGTDAPPGAESTSESVTSCR